MGVFGFMTPGPGEMMVILALGVLLFGKRLPEVGKNIGKGILEFKRGVNDFRESKEEKKAESEPALIEDSLPNDAPKFETP